MKARKRALSALLLAAFLLLSGCARHTDWFAPFRGAFEAEIEGKWHDVAFSASIKAEKAPEEGAREVTVTFYAPNAWRDTVLTQASDGKVTLTVGELSVSGESFAEIFSLFPATGEVTAVSLDEEGHTVVTGEDFSLTFLADGTPYRAECGALSATVVRFERL